MTRTKRMSRYDFRPRACTGKRSFKGVEKNKDPEDVVVIDEDGDDLPDVMIIDCPDYLQQNFRGSSVHWRKNRAPHHKVISIDDEDSDIEHPNFANPGASELDSDATSSKRSFPSPDITSTHAASVDQCHNVRAGQSSSKSPESESSLRGKAPCRDCCGLSHEAAHNLSGSDCSDCEVLEGSSEELREQWEKAYSKRKHESFNRRYGREDHASASTFDADRRAYSRVDFTDYFCPGGPAYWFSTCDDFEESFSHVNIGEPGTFHYDQENDQMRSQTMGQDQFKETCTDSVRAHSQHRASCSNNMDFRGDKRNMGSSRPVSPISSNCDDEEPNLYRSEVPDEANVPECSLGGDADMNFENDSCGKSSSPSGKLPEKDVIFEEALGDQLMKKSRLSDERESKNDDSVEGDVFMKSRANFAPEARGGAQGEPEYPGEVSCTAKDHDSLVTSPSEPHPAEGTCSEGSPTMQDSIINEREKLKETDEYRRAQEEEWASRQEQLRQQANEAQRLKRRRKAERRILDMEKRQKQRLEEMRSTQKKDEENMNLKEQLRTEIRKELSKLEFSCIDMPSLLRSLGIQLGSSPLPLEVHAAYKRAVLRFHPDRASKSDIRQQVEAEEKFKLISRMKEKFMLTSCH